MDTLRWVPEVYIVDPTQEWLQSHTERVWIIITSISVSRSPLCETSGIINKMVTTLSVGGRVCISDVDTISVWNETGLVHLCQMEETGTVEVIECVDY